MSLITENKQIFSIMEQIRQDMKTYFVIKTATSFSTGLLSYIVLWVFGIDFALFWAFLIFLLNYIPTIGSIIAVFFPVVFSIIQFESFSIFVLLLVSLSLVQMLIGNFLEPRFLGNKLNVSPLVILLSLLFWGQIWWVVGMLLCVPIVVIINIILAHIPATRSIAILLSEKWNIKIGDDDSLSKWRFMLKKMKKKIMKK
jgi:predicted PurR-regulated permease PerM